MSEKKAMNIFEKLAAIQQEVRAPKNLTNTFGGYNYRSAEGILEAVKPVLQKYGATILLSDDIEQKGDRVYVRATVWLYDPEDLENMKITVTAYAREANERKGMDPAQITGTASSYARKYALNGLLLLDDAKDPDTNEYAVQQGGIHPDTIDLAKKLANMAGVSLSSVLKKPLNELTKEEGDALINELNKRLPRNGNESKIV